MNTLLTLTISASPSVLKAEYFQPTEYWQNNKSAHGLVKPLTFNLIPNVDVGKNQFYMSDQVVTIHPGCYEIQHSEKYTQMSLANGERQENIW